MDLERRKYIEKQLNIGEKEIEKLMKLKKKRKNQSQK